MDWAEKIKKFVYIACEVLELLAAALMVVGIGLAIVGFLMTTSLFRGVLSDPAKLMGYVEHVFTIVIGIEFLQMLCKPNNDNVIEILIFLVARHMIVGDTSPVQDLISVGSITILFLLRAYLHDRQRKREKERLAMEAQRNAQEATAAPAESWGHPER